MIALDTNIFIYVLNANSQFGPDAARLLKTVHQPKIASELVFAEILASPKLLEISLQNKVLSFLNSLDIEWQKVTKDVLFEAARLRRLQPSCKLADAIHIASGVIGQAEAFVTNDQDLLRFRDVGIDIRSL